MKDRVLQARVSGAYVSYLGLVGAGAPELERETEMFGLTPEGSDRRTTGGGSLEGRWRPEWIVGSTRRFGCQLGSLALDAEL